MSAGRRRTRPPLAMIGKCPKCGYVLHEGQKPCDGAPPPVDPTLTALSAERDEAVARANTATVAANLIRAERDEAVAKYRALECGMTDNREEASS